MIKKLKDNVVIMELIFSIASAVIFIHFSEPFWTEERLLSLLFNVGVDLIGLLVCAALIYGSMRQKSEGTRDFRLLILLTDFSFLINLGISYTVNAPDMRTICFVFCLVSKLMDLAMILIFYRYVRITLKFEGKLAGFTTKILSVLMVLEILLLLSNFFFPTTYWIDEKGAYFASDLSWTEDIMLITAGILTTILIIRSNNPRKQKFAALLFIILPVLEYAYTGGVFGNAGQYGVNLVSLIIMYCVIFNEKSQKLASTQVELDMATQIQSSMLPNIFPVFPERKEFDIYASMDPAKEVGGDFYDLFMIDEDHLAMVIADVSGKGIPAALFMMSSKILINDHAIMGGTPAEILERVNKQVFSTNKAHMFVTVWLGIFEISTGKLTSASAGHEYPMININGKYEILKDKHGLAIGAAGISKYKNTEITLKKGDSIFVYTDGVAEANNAAEELFGTDRTLEALNAIHEGASQKEVLAGVRAAVDTFVKEAPQFDDLTMLGMKYFGPENKTETEES